MSWELERESMRGLLKDQEAEIERLKMNVLAQHALIVAYEKQRPELNAEIERLKKVLEQAIEFWLIEMSQIDVTTRETGEPFCPELAAYLKEKS